MAPIERSELNGILRGGRDFISYSKSSRRRGHKKKKGNSHRSKTDSSSKSLNHQKKSAKSNSQIKEKRKEKRETDFSDESNADLDSSMGLDEAGTSNNSNPKQNCRDDRR